MQRIRAFRSQGGDVEHRSSSFVFGLVPLDASLASVVATVYHKAGGNVQTYDRAIQLAMAAHRQLPKFARVPGPYSGRR